MTAAAPNRTLAFAVAVTVLVLLPAACQSEAPPAAPPPAAPLPTLPAPADAYAEQISSDRAGRVERVRANWLTLTGLHWLAEGDNRFGSGSDNSIVFPQDTSPDVAGNFVYEDGTVFLEPVPGAGLTLNGEPAGDARLQMVPDSHQLGLGRLEFHLIVRSDRHAIRVRDPESPAARDFEGIDFYPVDPAYVIEGTLTPPDEFGVMTLETVVGRDTKMLSRGTIEFDFAGTTRTLQALGEGTEVFVMFKDGTTGRETYAAGRYLYAPVVGDTVTLDFNKAFNPPCAFTPYATCPLPPPGNTIDASIEAGERVDSSKISQ